MIKKSDLVYIWICVTPVLLLSIITIIILIYSSIPKHQQKLTESIEYSHDIYHIEKITQKDYTKFVTRMEINNIIEELGVSSVIPFFNQYTKNSYISAAIVQKAIEMEVPVNIAFSLVWRESKFNIKNMSPKNKNGSRDWGLFQLNDSYYKWDREQFFDVEKNVQAGVAHLEYCLEEMNDVQLALAAYNAGVYGIRNYGIPPTTERHITIILEYEDQINQDFNKWLQTRS